MFPSELEGRILCVLLGERKVFFLFYCADHVEWSASEWKGMMRNCSSRGGSKTMSTSVFNALIPLSLTVLCARVALATLIANSASGIGLSLHIR